MALISRSIPTLLRGLSQSSDALKRLDHAEIQDNANSEPVLGLIKRPGSEFVSQIATESSIEYHGEVTQPEDTKARIFVINKSVNDNYVVMIPASPQSRTDSLSQTISGADIRIFDFDGNEKNVHRNDIVSTNTPTTGKYLLPPNSVNNFVAQDKIKTMNIADFTFIVNTDIKVEYETSDGSGGDLVTPGNITQAIIFFNQVSDKTTYTVTVDGVTATKNTASDDPLSTSTVAGAIKTTLDSGLSGFTIAQNGSVLHIKKTDNTDFSITASDTQGNTQITVVKDSVQRFTDLPIISPNGMVVEIKGDTTSNVDNYYVKFVTENGGAFEKGQWEESVKPGIRYKLKYDTMPHVLIQQADGDFRFSQADGSEYTIESLETAAIYNLAYDSSTGVTITVTQTNHGLVTGDLISARNVSGNLITGTYIITKVNDNSFTFTYASSSVSAQTNQNCKIGEVYTIPKWGERTVGDELTAPDPSFINKKINNIFFFRNRLGFLSDDKVILSKVSEFFNFFPETVTTVVDNDPIDISSSHNKISILKNTATVGKQLIIFSDETQFILSASSDSLTPTSANLVVATEFVSNTKAAPVAFGSSVYYLTTKNNFTGVREYIVQDGFNVAESADITLHVPKLIPKDAYKIAVSTSEDLLVVAADTNANKLYVNRWLYGENNRKVLSSWFTYTIGGKTLHEQGTPDIYPSQRADTRILDIHFIGSDLYIICKQQIDDGYNNANDVEDINIVRIFIEKIPFAFVEGGDNVEVTNAGVTSIEPTQSDFKFNLDHKVTEKTTGVSITYDSTTDKTTFTLPYLLYSNMQIIGRHLTETEETLANTSTFVDTQGNTKTLKPGTIIATTNSKATEGTFNSSFPLIHLASNPPNTITASGDYRNSKIIIGEPYLMHYRFCKQKYTASPDAQSSEILSGRLQLKHFYFKYENTGSFKVEVTPKHRDLNTYNFTGRFLGLESSTIGAINISTGMFQVPIMSNAMEVDIDIKNDTFLPTILTSAEYEANFHLRSRRA